MKVKIIVQVRVGSTRLPGKALLEIVNKPALEHVLERVSRASSADDIIVATTDNEQDNGIVEFCNKMKVKVFCGSEDDVLDRFYHAAYFFNAEDIVRITADCPLIDPEIIDKVVDCYFKNNADYCSNILEETFPDGEDVEVFRFKTLKTSWSNARLLSEREHVTSYIIKHPEMFKLVNYKNDQDLSGKRWTLDTQEDFVFIKTIFENLYKENPCFNMKDILTFIGNNRELESINKNLKRNQGYLNSLENDKEV